MNKAKVIIGMKVTCLKPVPAYYSAYAGNPGQLFEPGMVGTVARVDVPSVHREKVTFCCVDFEGKKDISGRNKWRVALLYDNIAIVCS